MTDEKRKQFAEVVLKDEETAKKYLSMDPTEVAAAVSKDGMNFTADEIVELGSELAALAEKSKSGELNEDALDNVSGGFLFTAVAVGWTALNVGVFGTAYAYCKWYRR